MPTQEITVQKAALFIGVNEKYLRGQLRRDRPTGARQDPPRKGGTWLLQRSLVADLADRRGRKILPQQRQPSAPTASVSISSDVSTGEGHRIWSQWVPFAQALTHAPPNPGVYMLRSASSDNADPVYIGMAGERQGKGLRGRLSVYATGKGATSGLGEHALNRALADTSWLRELLLDAEQGMPKSAKELAKAAIARANLEIRWQTLPTGDEARSIERELIRRHRESLWNV